MDGACNKFFARSGLSLNQDRSAVVGNPGDMGTQVLDWTRIPDNPMKHVDGCESGGGCCTIVDLIESAACKYPQDGEELHFFLAHLASLSAQYADAAGMQRAPEWNPSIIGVISSLPPGFCGYGQDAMAERVREGYAVRMPGCTAVQGRDGNNAFSRNSNLRQQPTEKLIRAALKELASG